MSSPGIKNISLLQKCEIWHMIRHPVPLRGAYHDRSRTWGGLRWTPVVPKRTARKRTVKTCGPDVAVLASMHLEATASQGATEAKEPFSGESSLYAVKPLRRECRIASAALYAHARTLLCTLRMRSRVQRASGI